MSPEFVHKYMQTAKTFGQVKNACKSRKIGTLIVNPTNNRIIGAGYNSPPKSVPHCDDLDFIYRYFLPKINARHDYRVALADFHTPFGWDVEKLNNAFCHACPRRVMGLESGEGSELCTCAHSEQNAIANKCESAHDAYMFAYCGIPCRDCAKMIVNAGISRVYIASDEIYHRDSIEFFKDANVMLFLYSEPDGDGEPAVTRLDLETL